MRFQGFFTATLKVLLALNLHSCQNKKKKETTQSKRDKVLYAVTHRNSNYCSVNITECQNHLQFVNVQVYFSQS